MNRIERSFRSPLTLVEGWRDRLDGARLREVLITGYTLDLGFLEKFVISTVRALGARITVLSDAGQAVHDPVDVRRAGTVYQHGHAACRGAFHPKLVVLLGDEDVWLAIGSGNPTMSGWGYNRELWVTVKSDLRRGPQVLNDVADWLVDLPNIVAVARWIAATLAHIAQQMRPAEVDDSWREVRAYGNLRQPLLDHLPAEPVDELRLAAPFYDPGAHAVRALVDRFKPRRVQVGLQPSLAAFDGAALATATEPVVEREFRLLDEDRMLHGKLIEWTPAGGMANTMTGSANITASALLRSTNQGGNCELAVVAPCTEWLLPEGAAQTASAIARLRSRPAERTANNPSVPVLLGCTLVDGALVVELAGPEHQPVTIETSPSGTPGTWLAVGQVPTKQDKAYFVVPELTGGVVRAVVEMNGERLESTPVFITDPTRCRPRRDVTNEPRLARTYEAEELFTDPQIAQRFTTDLARLTASIEPNGTRTAAATSDPGVTSPVNATDRWADYLEDCERALGPSLAGLVFPRKTANTASETVTWSIDDVDEHELSDDETEDILDDLETDRPAARGKTAPDIPPDQRGRYRTWAHRWVSAVTTPTAEDDPSSLPPLPARMLIARLYLTLLAAGIWRDEHDWRTDLRRLVGGLIPDDHLLDQTPAEAFDHLFAVLAVAMTLLREDAHLHGGREDDLLLTSAWQEAAEWVAYADIDLAEELLLPATQPFARISTVQQLRDTIELAQAAARDPYAEARAELEDEGLTVSLDHGTWLVDGASGNLYRAAARAAVTLGRTTDQAAVLARNANHAVLLLWADRTLLLRDSRTNVWRSYTLSPAGTPFSLVNGFAGPPPGARVSQPSSRPPEIRMLADLLGVDLPATVDKLLERRQ